MIEALVYAFVAGVILSFGFGSVFFVLIQNSIEFGFKAGMKIASGVLTSDLVLVFIAYFGTSILPDIPNFEFYSRGVAAFFLFGMAVSQFRESKPVKYVETYRVARFFYYFGKGFLLNILNPVNFLTWVVILAGLKSYNLERPEKFVFMATCLVTIFLSECLIAYYSGKIKRFLQPQTMRKVKLFSAAVFTIIALRLIWDMFS